MRSNALMLDDADSGVRSYTLFFTLSAAGHLAIFLMLMVFQNIGSHHRFEPSVINVDLVSLSAPSPPPQQTAAAPEPKVTTPVPVPEPPPVKVKTVVKEKTQAPRIKPKTSLKKKTYKPSRVAESAIAEVQKKLETSQSQNLQDRLAQLSQEVKTSGNAQRKIGRMNASGAMGSELINIYKTEILYYIQKNWSYNSQLSGDKKDLVALLGMKIMPDGEIREVWFDQHSGNRYFDETARKAVLKSNPLPPLPEGFNKTFLNQGLRFTPSGVK